MGQGLNLVSLVSIWSCYDDSGVHEGWHFMFCLAKHIFSHIKHMRLVFNVDVFLQAAQASIAVGSQVWVEDPDVAWIDGEVIKVNGDTVTVKCSNEKTVCCIWQVWGLVLAL